MATLLNFTNLKVTSRTIRLTCFDYDVIVVVVIWIMSEHSSNLTNDINTFAEKQHELIRCFVVVT